MIDLLILADDLSGANEVGVQFAKKGIPTRIVTNYQIDLLSLPKKISVVIVDSDSRHISPELAYARISHIVKQGLRLNIKHFYKKTDSTLRGNIGAELGALWENTPYKWCIFVPSHPQNNRFTRNGLQYIKNKLLEQTQFKNDPLSPIKNSFIPDIISHQTKTPVWVLEPVDIRLSVLKNKNGIFIINASSEQDIQDIAEILKILKDNFSIAGTGSLAEKLPDIFDLQGRKINVNISASNWLLINGSLTDTAFAQQNYIIRNRKEILGFKLGKEILLNQSESDLKNLIESIKSIKTKSCFLYTVRNRSEIADYISYGEKLGYKRDEVFRLITVNTGQIATIFAEILQIRNLCVWGGDTSRSVIDSLNCNIIKPLYEIEPGVSLSQMENGKIDGLIITKSGDFGSVDLVDKILALNMLKKR